jgi:hypothetical protein
MVPAMDPEDALYGLPLEEFVSERDALAKRLRADGDGEAAARVKALRRPTIAAWAVNQAVRTQVKDARELDAAGAALRKAQTALLEGKGNPADLRTATEGERAAVDRLVDAARGLLSGSGRPMTDAVLHDVTETLHAAAGDDETREAVLAGRLDRERRPAGLGGELAALAAIPDTPTRPAKATRAAARPAAKRDDARHAERRDQLRAARAGARKTAEAAKDAEREHAATLTRLRAADAVFQEAKDDLDTATAAEREARKTRDRLAREADRRRAAVEKLEAPLSKKP